MKFESKRSTSDERLTSILGSDGKPLRDQPKPHKSKRVKAIWIAVAGFLAVAAGAFSNVDTILSKIRSWRDPALTTIKPFPHGARALLIPRRALSSSPMIVEAVYAPLGEPNLYKRHYDVYLYNPTRADVLLTSVHYFCSTAIPHGDAFDSGPMMPNIQYTIEYEFPTNWTSSGTVPLVPPYRIGKGARSAIRFYFHPSEEVNSMPLWLTFDLVDSAQRNVRVVDNSDN